MQLRSQAQPRFSLLVGLLALSLMLTGSVQPATAQQTDDTPEPVDGLYTFTMQTGSRYLPGTGAGLSLAHTFELPPGEVPAWVLLHSDDSSLAYAYSSESGVGFSGVIPLQGGEPVPDAEISAPSVPWGWHSPEGLRWWEPLPADLSPLTHPTLAMARMVYVAANGDVVLYDTAQGRERVRETFNALPDARVVLDSSGSRAAVYIGATNTRYVHAVLGDDLEAASLVVLSLYDLDVEARIDLPGNAVFEGLSPLWADINEDGVEDLVTTVSDGAVGAAIHVYDSRDGSLIAQGPAIGQGGRWRHQLAWGPFGPNGERELVAVKTPHIGGVVEYYRYDGQGGLNIVAELPGYTSHIITSRNLDMAAAADFNGDGQPELALPTQDRSVIAGLQRDESGVREVWRFGVPNARVVTNLAVTTIPEAGLALVFGTDRGRVHLYMPLESSP